MMQKLIFSDVDGCLINGEHTDFVLINDYLQRVANHGFTLILASAKTASEIIKLNTQINLPGPFIIENGAGILFKDNPQIANQEIVNLDNYYLLKLVSAKPDVQTLSAFCPKTSLLTQMSDQNLCSITGLSLENATLAKTRFFTEPIYIQNLTDAALRLLKSRLRKAKFYFIQTNKFLHVYLHKNIHKASAIRFLQHHYYQNKLCRCSAIGDSFNDYSMLNLCHQAYFITQIPAAEYPKRWHILPKINLTGWQMAIEMIIRAG